MPNNNFDYRDFFDKPRKSRLPVIIGLAVFTRILFCAYKATDTKTKIFLYVLLFVFLIGIYFYRMFKNIGFILKEMYKDRSDD